MVSKFKRKGVIQMQTAMPRPHSLNVSRQTIHKVKLQNKRPTEQFILPVYSQAELQEHMEMLMRNFSEETQHEEVDFGVFGDELL
jgi:hypothetical protein